MTNPQDMEKIKALAMSLKASGLATNFTEAMEKAKEIIIGLDRAKPKKEEKPEFKDTEIKTEEKTETKEDNSANDKRIVFEEPKTEEIIWIKPRKAAENLDREHPEYNVALEEKSVGELMDEADKSSEINEESVEKLEKYEVTQPAEDTSEAQEGATESAEPDETENIEDNKATEENTESDKSAEEEIKENMEKIEEETPAPKQEFKEPERAKLSKEEKEMGDLARHFMFKR